VVRAASRGCQRSGLTLHLDFSHSRYLELPTGRIQQLEAAADAEFGHIEIVRQDHWRSLTGRFSRWMAASWPPFYNIIERTVSIDGRPVRVAGVNNVITLPAYRGRGIASRLLRESQSVWFDSLGAECGLLLCADALLPFYRG